MKDGSPPKIDERSIAERPGGEATVSAYELLGGESGLRAIIDDFVERVVSDMMIGFLFRKVEKPRLKELEFQFASRHLGGPHRYEGRPLPEAHRAHSIMGGQFNRRLRLLEKTLEDHGAPDEARALWLRHNEKLRAQITDNAPDECAAPASTLPPRARDLKPEREKESNS
jgi:hemoglobin